MTQPGESVADACILAVARRYGIPTHPLEHVGFRSLWDGLPLELAAAAIWQLTSCTKGDVADQLGISTGATAIHNADRHQLDEDLVGDVEARIGYMLHVA